MEIGILLKNHVLFLHMQTRCTEHIVVVAIRRDSLHIGISSMNSYIEKMFWNLNFGSN